MVWPACLTDTFIALPYELANVDLVVIALHVPAEIPRLSCDLRHLIEAEVNPAEGGRAIDEYGQYANNSREQTETVRDEVGPGDDDRSVLGNP